LGASFFTAVFLASYFGLAAGLTALAAAFFGAGLAAFLTSTFFSTFGSGTGVDSTASVCAAAVSFSIFSY
jgi:hypothetical protein